MLLTVITVVAPSVWADTDEDSADTPLSDTAGAVVSSALTATDSDNLADNVGDATTSSEISNSVAAENTNSLVENTTESEGHSVGEGSTEGSEVSEVDDTALTQEADSAVEASPDEGGQLELTDSLESDMLGASLEELLNTPVEVWTATKTAEHIEEAPSIIEVITAEDFEQWGYESVGDALQHMLGFYVIDNHKLPNAAVRGVTGVSDSESGLIKVMIDGRSAAFRATAGNWLGPELIPLSAVARIEVIRGPASALYGADAFLATINVVLKSPADIDGVILNGRLGMEANTMGNLEENHPDQQYNITAATSLGDFGLMLSFATEKGSRNGLALPETSPDPTVPGYNAGKKFATGVYHDSSVWYGQLSYQKERGSLKLSAYGSSIERGGEFSQWSQLSHGLDQAGKTNGSHIHLTRYLFGLDGMLNASDKLKLSLSTTFFYGKPTADDRIEVASELYYVQRKFKYKGFNTVVEGVWMPLDRLSIVAGLELLLDEQTLPNHNRVDKLTGDVLTLLSEADSENQKLFLNPAAYLQANVTAVPDLLKITGGLRFDYHDIYGSQVTGRAGTVFLWTRNFTTKLLYGSAFKAPSPSLMYGQPMAPGDVIGNPNLKPQYVHTIELAPALQLSRHWVLHSTLAYNIIKDKADYIPDGINRKAANVAEVQGLSWETKIDFKYEKIVNAYVGFEWQKVLRELGREGYEAQLIGIENVITPPWMIKAGISTGMPFLAPVPLRLTVQSMIVAPRRASDENIVENGGSYDLPAYGMLDASLSFTRIKVFKSGETTFSVRGYNLLDSEGPDPGFAGVDYPLQRRRFMLEVLQTF